MLQRNLALFSLVVAGEAIFLLPFVLARVFRPTLLDVFGLTNLQLGTAFSLYGVVAMFSYFVGGPIADRVATRTLIIVALLVTSAGGLLMATIPPIGVLIALYGFWGLTTILLFWAALIKSTRAIGGANQGRAFGILDAGRGLFAALLALIAVLFFSRLLPVDVASSTLADRGNALAQVILIFSGMGVLAALLIWCFLPAPHHNGAGKAHVAMQNTANSFQGLRHIAKLPTVWLQALIVLCAYVAYKSTDNFALYARDVFAYNDVQAAWIGTVSFWMRPIAAIAAGLLADRFDPVKALLFSFGIVALGSLVLALGAIENGTLVMLLMLIAGTSAGIYALRALYFAIFAEARVSLAFTGAAIGLVSFVGFTPDIFMGPLAGYLLDNAPGAEGHRHVFMLVLSFSLLGIMASYLFASKKQSVPEQ